MSNVVRTERNLNFDEIVNRRESLCLKYNCASDVLPLWVADMDFKTSSFIQDALAEQVGHGIFGYSNAKEEYFEALQGFFRRRHDFEIESPSWVVRAPGVIFILAMACKTF